ncbi:hypothetical protein C8Q74DRAFT_677980 [Fomes fomentarius]|nr:hypothetical protein C8Q74DRAFT_677980 [Fomes fomentarius]
MLTLALCRYHYATHRLSRFSRPLRPFGTHPHSLTFTQVRIRTMHLASGGGRPRLGSCRYQSGCGQGASSQRCSISCSSSGARSTRSRFGSSCTTKTTKGLSPILKMVQPLPMFVVGELRIVVIVLLLGHVNVMTSSARTLPDTLHPHPVRNPQPRYTCAFPTAIGTLNFTAAANVLFAVIVPSASYWAFSRRSHLRLRRRLYLLHHALGRQSLPPA